MQWPTYSPDHAWAHAISLILNGAVSGGLNIEAKISRFKVHLAHQGVVARVGALIRGVVQTTDFRQQVAQVAGIEDP